MAFEDIMYTSVANARALLEEEILCTGGMADTDEVAIKEIHILASIACSLKKLATPVEMKVNVDPSIDWEALMKEKP